MGWKLVSDFEMWGQWLHCPEHSTEGETEVVYFNTSYWMVLSSVAKFIHGKAKKNFFFALLQRDKWNILSQNIVYSNVLNIDSHPNSDSKFVGLYFYSQQWGGCRQQQNIYAHASAPSLNESSL